MTVKVILQKPKLLNINMKALVIGNIIVDGDTILIYGGWRNDLKITEWITLKRVMLLVQD
jgi:hypothetical protein